MHYFWIIFVTCFFLNIYGFSQTPSNTQSPQTQTTKQQQTQNITPSSTLPSQTQIQNISESQSISIPNTIQEEDQKQRVVPEITKLEDYIKRDIEKDFVFSLRVILGSLSMEKIPFLYGRVQPAIKYKLLAFALDLNLEVITEDKDRSPYTSYKTGDIRKDEWKQLRAYPNKILFLTIGDRYDYPIFIHIGRITDYSLGNTFLVYRYTNTLYSPDILRTGAEVKIDYKSFGVEGFTSDITDLNIIAGRVFIRPFGLTDYKHSIIGLMEMSFNYAMDRNFYNRKRENDRTYVPNTIEGPSIKAYSLDFFMPVFKSKALSMGVFFTFAKIFDYDHGYQLGIKGDIADGFIFYRIEGRLMYGRFISPIFNSQWDVQKKLSYFGVNHNLSYLDNLKNDEVGGSIFIEFKNMWLQRKIGFIMSYEMYIIGKTKLRPHFQFGFFIKRGVLSDKFALRFIVDKVNLYKANALKLSDLDTIFTIEASILITLNIDFVFKYIKAYTENPAGIVIGNEVIMLETRITF